jgi:tetratricopeptide (TPR) repeat protein
VIAQVGPSGDPNVLRNVQFRLGLCLLRTSKFAEAEPIFVELVALKDSETARVQGWDAALARKFLGDARVGLQKWSEAADDYAWAVTRCEERGGSNGQLILPAKPAIGALLLRAERWSDAEPFLRQWLVGLRETPGTAPQTIASALASLGHSLNQQEKFAEAEPVLRESLRIREKAMPDNWLRYNAMSLLGGCLTGLKRFEEAEPLLLEGWEKMDPPSRASNRKKEARERIVLLYEGWGKPEKAADWKSPDEK